MVIKYGQGGRVDEHISQFAIYRNTGANVGVRGPCYSACTMLTTYIEREKLCIAPGAFMAFHAVRGMERRQYMAADTQLYYSNLPQHIRDWIDGNGGWQELPLNGFWTLYDRELWAMGYPNAHNPICHALGRAVRGDALSWSDNVRPDPRVAGRALPGMNRERLVLGFVLLAANVVAAQAEDRKCIREMYELTRDMAVAKRLCDPKNYVTDPNEYGWGCDSGHGGPMRVKGHGANNKRMRFCE